MMNHVDNCIADYRMGQMARRLARRLVLRCLICLDLFLSAVAALVTTLTA